MSDQQPTTTRDTANSRASDPSHVHLGVAMLLGFLALVSTIGVWWIGYTAGVATYPPFDLADVTIRMAPGDFAVWAIANFQFNAQELALLGGIVAWLVLGILLGLVLRLRPEAMTGAILGLAAAPLAVILAYASDEASGAGYGIWLSIWFGVTLAAPLALVGRWMEQLEIEARDQTYVPSQGDWIDQPASSDRRAILRNAIGGALAFGFGGWAIGSLLRGTGVADAQTGAGQPLDSVRASLDGTPVAGGSTTPVPSTTLMPVNVIGEFDAPAGVRPAITSNEDFYTIDISTRDPVIQEEQWTLKITGLVNEEMRITYDELLSMPPVEQAGTLMCISFTYGSDLISNTHWTGVRLRDVLQMTGVGDGAVEVILRGGGGYSDSISIDKALDSQTLLAYGMHGKTLPREHGFPCRLYVPNIYGEKNVKWLEEIEVVDFDYTGFWQERGWDEGDEEAAINIVSIIDTPHGEVTADASGAVPVGGVAFAGSRGIQSVQLQIDGGPWIETTVEPYEPELVWQRWKYDWPAEPGEHSLTVKAIDGEGAEQIATENPPFPVGMTGLQEVQVQVL